MSTSELVRPQLEVGDLNYVSNPAEVYDYMRSIAPPGQGELDYSTLETLNELTQRLVALHGAQSIEEYRYYVDTQNRRLEVAEDKLREHLQGKTVLVSGGTGLIGSALLKELSRFSPARVVSVSRGTMEPHQPVTGVEYSYADVRDRARILAIMQAVQPDVVYHVAADKYNHEAETRAHHTLSTNINGTKNMLEAAEATGVEHFIYASTGKATRPYSPDIYASSKKTGEWLVSEAASRGNMLCSAGRFTHVVDSSSLLQKFHGSIESGQPVRVHNPDTWFYVQSAQESAQLLMNSALEAEKGTLKIHSIRDLKRPVNLGRFGLGAIMASGERVPLYIQGVEEGYEEKAWPGLYHPVSGVEVGPLVSSLEAEDAVPSATCPEVDAFPLKIQPSANLEADFSNLQQILNDAAAKDGLRTANQRMTWTMLDARLDALPADTLERTRQHVAMFSQFETQTPEHLGVNLAIARAIQRRQAI